MPTLLEDTQCNVCPQRHNFTLLEEGVRPGANYEYVCPETGHKGSLRPRWAGEQVEHPPQGAIALTPAAAP